MKVKVLEQYKKTSKVITEAADSTDDSDLILDASGSVSELADDIKDMTAEANNGEATMSDAEAAKVAVDIKANADAIGANDVALEPSIVKNDRPLYLEIKNALTDALDDCLAGSRNTTAMNAAGAEHGNLIPVNDNNLLIIGPPGCAKTSIVKNWVAQHQLSLFSINMRDRELYAYINGYPVKTDEDGKAVIKQAYSKNLDPLDDPDTEVILFLDEFNRQTDETIRQTVMEVVKEKIVGADNRTGKKLLRGLRFTVAVMNPPDGLDRGLAKIGEAEADRFPNFVKYKSTKNDTLDYINNVIKSELKTYLAAHKAKSNYKYLGDFADTQVFADAVYNALLRWHLCNFLLLQDSFKFDYDYDNLSPEQAASMERAAKQKRNDNAQGLLSQRTMSNTFMRPAGFFEWGKKPLADLKDKIMARLNITTDKRQMLANLIDSYISLHDVLSAKVGANMEVGPEFVDILDEGGRDLLNICGYTAQDIAEIESALSPNAAKAQQLEQPDAAFEAGLKAAGDDVSKIATVGLKPKTKAGDTNNILGGLAGLGL